MGKTYTQAFRDHAVELVKGGMSRESVGKTIGVHHITVGRWAKGAERVNPVNPANVKKEALRRISAGATPAQVARDMDLLPASVAHWSKLKKIEQGLPLKPQPSYTPEFKSEALSLLESGLRTAEVARRMGSVTTDTLRLWMEVAIDNGSIKSPPKKSPIKADLELMWVVSECPQHEQWRILASAWIKGEAWALSQRIDSLRAFFIKYLVAQHLPPDPSALLLRKNVVPDFYKSACGESRGGTNKNNTIYRFLNWVLIQPDFSDIQDDLAPLTSPAFRNPVQYIEHGKGPRHTQSVNPVLPYGYVQELRSMLATGENFRDWVWAQNALGKENLSGDGGGTDWFSVTADQIDINDPDCVYRTKYYANEKVPPLLQMWSPVRWVALLAKLQMPARLFQVRMLDSGEADTFRYSKGTWTKNLHPLAQGTAKKLWSQGVFRRLYGADIDKTVLYFNTNKTADRLNSGVEKGFECPWPVMGSLPDQPHYWLEKLRGWQEKYNPIGRKTSWQELGVRELTNDKFEVQKARYPDACFLFRFSEAKDKRRRYLPIPSSNVENCWPKLLHHFENVLAESGQSHADGSPIQFLNLGPDTPTYSLHCLRVSLITSLVLDGDMSLQDMVQIVGHSRMVMTLYYTKPGFTHMHDALQQGSARMEEKKAATIVAYLKDTEYSRLLDQIVCNSSEVFAANVPQAISNRNPAGWMTMFNGLCLMGGNEGPVDGSKVGGCFNGGAALAGKFGGLLVHGPVPGGARNCIRCRWFVTFSHYLPALVAHLNNIEYRLSEAGIDTSKKYEHLQTIKRIKAEAETAGKPFEDLEKLRTAERIYESAHAVFGELLQDKVQCYKLILRVQAVTNIKQSSGMEMIAVGEETDVHLALEDTNSELLQLSAVCEGLELYADLAHGKAVIKRSQWLDIALENDSVPPMFYRLSEDNQLKAGNEFMRWLAQKANPISPMLGMRTICDIADAGKSISAALGIDLNEFIADCSQLPRLTSEVPQVPRPKK